MNSDKAKAWICKECGDTDEAEAYDDTICSDCYIAELEGDDEEDCEE